MGHLRFVAHQEKGEVIDIPITLTGAQTSSLISTGCHGRRDLQRIPKFALTGSRPEFPPDAMSFLCETAQGLDIETVEPKSTILALQNSPPVLERAHVGLMTAAVSAMQVCMNGCQQVTAGLHSCSLLSADCMFEALTETAVCCMKALGIGMWLSYAAFVCARIGPFATTPLSRMPLFASCQMNNIANPLRCCINLDLVLSHGRTCAELLTGSQLDRAHISTG